MADFCYQCTEELFGDGTNNDLAGITAPAAEGQGLYAQVLCEGCGFIQVDSRGRCLSDDCLKHHGRKPLDR